MNRGGLVFKLFLDDFLKYTNFVTFHETQTKKRINRLLQFKTFYDLSKFQFFLINSPTDENRFASRTNVIDRPNIP